ncbi:phosphotransferase [Clostridium sp. C8-1-8]|uniref:phosphotransferase n=1 Tax=Clostridium sp. C8-1-8 TaxID=2698831 RepID=UPI00136B3790|nr:phosphotransferase [Clostridium sp. C8-1-8]
MIPDNKKAAVKKALQTTFGVDTYDEINPITIGLSNALTFRIVIKSKCYLMKIARTDTISDTLNYSYMKAGAEIGVAPRVWYISSEDKISITDFIQKKPFPMDKAREIMPKLISKLHKLPPFHKLPFDAMDGIVKRVLTSKLLPDSLNDDILKTYNLIKSVYPSNPEEFVSCHNDLKPENYIFDGEQAWLVDWEAAFLNDRYLDLAVVANFVVNNETEEINYLKDYFGEDPDKYKRSQFFLMQQLLHIQYLCIFVMYASKTISIKFDNIKVDFKEFHERMWQGKIDLANDEMKLEYALVHMNKLLSNINTKRFKDSLDIISKK